MSTCSCWTGVAPTFVARSAPRNRPSSDSCGSPRPGVAAAPGTREGLDPRLTEADHELLERVLAGDPDQQIADVSGQALARVSHDVATLAHRMMAATSGSSGAASSGEHRRDI